MRPLQAITQIQARTAFFRAVILMSFRLGDEGEDDEEPELRRYLAGV